MEGSGASASKAISVMGRAAQAKGKKGKARGTQVDALRGRGARTPKSNTARGKRKSVAAEGAHVALSLALTLTLALTQESRNDDDERGGERGEGEGRG